MFVHSSSSEDFFDLANSFVESPDRRYFYKFGLVMFHWNSNDFSINLRTLFLLERGNRQSGHSLGGARQITSPPPIFALYLVQVDVKGFSSGGTS